MSFSERLNQLLRERGISAYRLAKDIGVSGQTVSNWKNGSIPSADQVITVADYFNVSTDYLLKDSDSIFETEIPQQEILESISVDGIHLSLTDKNISDKNILDIIEWLRNQQKEYGH